MSDGQIEVVEPEEKKSVMELPMNGDFNPERAIAQAEKRVVFFNQIKNVSLKATHPGDWVDQAGKPYLQGSGVEKLKPIWGIYFKNITIEKIPDGDRCIFECKGIAGSNVTKEESEFIGGRNANDKFFTGKDNLKEVDLMDVRKAAYTNFEVNAVMRLLGMRNLTWEDLKDGGIVRGETTKVEYKTGSQGGQVKGDDKTEKLRKEIGDMIMELCHGDVNVAKATLIEYTEWEKDGTKYPGKDSITKLSPKQVPVIYGKVKKDFEEYVKKEGGTV